MNELSKEIQEKVDDRLNEVKKEFESANQRMLDTSVILHNKVESVCIKPQYKIYLNYIKSLFKEDVIFKLQTPYIYLPF